MNKLYVVQITIPFNELTKSVDNVVIGNIFKEAHRSQFIVSDEYKYILGFPEANRNSIGTIVQIFAKNKEDLIKHIKDDNLYSFITDYCSFSIIDIEYNSLKNIDTYSLKTSQEDNYLSLSRIKRLIKRSKNTGKSSLIYDMFKNGKSEIEIYNIIKEKNNNIRTNPYIKYTSTSSDNFSIFIKSINRDERDSNIIDMLDNNDVNSFGMNNNIILPKIVF